MGKIGESSKPRALPWPDESPWDKSEPFRLARPASGDAMVRFSRKQQPNPDLNDLYAAKYERYKQVIEALDGIWADLA